VTKQLNGDDHSEPFESKMIEDQAKAYALSKLESSGELTPEFAAMIDEVVSVGGKWDQICNC
jgi:hypothetical protein